MKQLPTLQELHKIRQQLNRIESQIHRSQQMYTDIAIDNKTGQELKLTINLEDQIIDIKSKLNLPSYSSVTQKIIHQPNQQKSIQKNHSLPLHQQLSQQKRNDPYYSRNQQISVSREYQHLSSTRLEQKFQPITRLNTTKKPKLQKQTEPFKQQQHQTQQKEISEENLANLKELTKNINEITHINEQQSLHQLQNKQESSLIQSKYVPIADKKANQILIEDSHTSNIYQQNTSPIPLPYSIQGSNHQQVPQIIHHYKTQPQQQKENLQQQTKTSQLNWSLHSPERSSLKQPKESLNTQWRIDRITASPKRILNLQSKTYKQRSNKKRQVSKNQVQQRDKKVRERLHTDNFIKSSKSRNKENVTKDKKIQKIADSAKADDLFEKRKKQCLNKLAKQRKLINSIRKTERERSLSSDTIRQQYNNRQIKIKTNTLNNPLIEQITTRLHLSKLKNPCEHFQRFSQSQQKQRFNQLVSENTIVCKYLSHNQKDQLFQRLRRSKDSVSVWPIKIVNQAYSKLKRITNPPNTL